MDAETCQALTDQQQRLLGSLLKSPTVAAAAKLAGCSERSAYRWLADDPGFREAYRSAKRATIEQAVMRIAASVDTAVDTLLAVAADESAPAGARVQAAGKVIDTAFRSLELDDLGGRVEALEAKAALVNGNGYVGV